ncbi:hypothetical protein RhiJN_29018 [Ceratobasidium sp. AG-Ba]|nr:hypothetical protein RhiJN_29018 [Ceratobasidium sp. AG-Ba]
MPPPSPFNAAEKVVLNRFARAWGAATNRATRRGLWDKAVDAIRSIRSSGGSTTTGPVDADPDWDRIRMSIKRYLENNGSKERKGRRRGLSDDDWERMVDIGKRKGAEARAMSAISTTRKNEAAKREAEERALQSQGSANRDGSSAPNRDGPVVSGRAGRVKSTTARRRVIMEVVIPVSRGTRTRIRMGEVGRTSTPSPAW